MALVDSGCCCWFPATGLLGGWGAREREKNQGDSHTSCKHQEYPFLILKPELVGFSCLHHSAYFWISRCVEFKQGYTRGENGNLTTISVIIKFWSYLLLHTKFSNRCHCILFRFYSFIQKEKKDEACLFYLPWNLDLFNFIFSCVKHYVVPKPKLWTRHT